MRRRDVLLGMAAAAVVSRAAAQEASKSAHIGFIVSGETFPRGDFFEALRRLGWVERRNLVVERRVTGENPERRQTAAAELIAANPDVIVAAGLIDAMPVHALTRTMPIVVIGGPDLIEEGLADSLARPGGNVTGIAILRGELDGKRLELLRELVPAATQVTRRHIDDQPPDTAVTHCRQFRGNELVMPVRRKWGARVELAETVLCEARKIGAK